MKRHNTSERTNKSDLTNYQSKKMLLNFEWTFEKKKLNHIGAKLLILIKTYLYLLYFADEVYLFYLISATINILSI